MNRKIGSPEVAWVHRGEGLTLGVALALLLFMVVF